MKTVYKMCTVAYLQG